MPLKGHKNNECQTLSKDPPRKKKALRLNDCKMSKETNVSSLKHAVSVTHRLPWERGNRLGAPKSPGAQGKQVKACCWLVAVACRCPTAPPLAASPQRPMASHIPSCSRSSTPPSLCVFFPKKLMLIMSPTWPQAKCKNKKVNAENLRDLTPAARLQHRAVGVPAMPRQSCPGDSAVT